MLLSTTVYSFTTFVCGCFALFEVPTSSVFWYIYVPTTIIAFIAGFCCINDKKIALKELGVFAFFWCVALFGIPLFANESKVDYIAQTLTNLGIFALICEWLYMRIMYLKKMKKEG